VAVLILDQRAARRRRVRPRAARHRESRDPDVSRSIDFAGILTSAAAAFFLLYGCTAGQELGFGDPVVLGSIVLALLLASGFVLVERSIRNPMVDLSLFSIRSFDGALIANSVMNIVFAGTTFLLTLYLQDVRGYSPVEAGLLLLPSTVTILVFNPIGGRVGRHRGARIAVVAGIALVGVGTFVTGLLGRDYSYAILASGLLIVGVGLGLMSTPLSQTAVAGPPERLAGTAAGLFKMTSMLGGAFGVAIMVALSKAFQTDEATDRATEAGLSSEQVDKLSNAIVDSDYAAQLLGGLPPDTRSAVEAALRQVEAIGTSGAIKTAAVFTLVATVALLFVWPRGHDRAADTSGAGSPGRDDAPAGPHHDRD
jgi:hypothetical protein